ncbi:hypothetical protein BO71DRAFT_61623 [Aspergillus ellipticus CBS 707.79]|uniref:Uncharacterized protein n=1 Tax=Aspergillus ellipticus CBS 707.79 TaxID=1448320 RepID=A0A319D0E7_9EURO|nr:hypothetical protein BO71DRAFT_61623 [Aspergillus ellipticus CBS 707.79]
MSARLAQWLRRLSYTQKILGSIPRLSIIFLSTSIVPNIIYNGVFLICWTCQFFFSCDLARSRRREDELQGVAGKRL